MVKAIAFDLDNTLIDFMKFKRETAKAAAEAMVKVGLDADPSEVADEIFEIYNEYGIEYQKTLSSLLWEKRKIRNYSRFEKIQQAGIVAYIDRKFDCLDTYPDVKPTLEKLNKPFYIVTDAPRNKAWQRMYITGLYPYFNTDEVFTLHKTKEKKPSEKPFKAFLEEADLEPEQVLFVGDSLEKDVKGASEVGMKTALAKYGQDHEEDINIEPDHTLQNFEEIQHVLE